MSDSVGGELRGKIEKSLVIQWGSGGGEQPPSIIHGYDARVLTAVCAAIAQANAKGRLVGKRYDAIIKQAAIISGASSSAGITGGLVYALAGYRPEVEEVIRAFKAFIQEEAKKYEREFPTELYIAWQRLYEIKAPPRGKTDSPANCCWQHNEDPRYGIHGSRARSAIWLQSPPAASHYDKY